MRVPVITEAVLRIFFLATSALYVSISLAQDLPVDSAVLQRLAAKAVAISGQVTVLRDNRPWAVSGGEFIPVAQSISTGPDGYGHFQVPGASSFDLFGNSRIIFRKNFVSPGDLLDLLSGRVRIHLRPGMSEQPMRVFAGVAILTAHEPATIALALDEDSTLRIDVIEGEIRVQHRLLPRNDPVLVKAIDAIIVRPNEQISRRVDRGSLYRYTVKILSAITPGHSAARNNDPIEGSKFLAESIRYSRQPNCGVASPPLE